MEFNQSQAIYLQIADYAGDRVLDKTWLPGEKIPSVRELAVILEVNPNTVMRAYEFLQQQGIIFTKRGLGYFTSPEAETVIREQRKKVLLEEELPRMLEKMNNLGLGPELLWQYIQAVLTKKQ